jgi:hypothetical protein
MWSPSSEATAPVSHRGLAVVGIRLLALYLLLQAVHELALQVAADAAGPSAAWLVPLLLGAVLWAGVGRVASVMIPVRRAVGLTAASASAGTSTVAALVFGGVGLFLIADTLPGVIADWLWLAPDERDPRQFLGQLLRLLIGVVVFVGARGFARLLGWLRYAGRAPSA